MNSKSSEPGAHFAAIAPTAASPPVPLNDLGRYASESAASLRDVAVEVLASGHYVLGPAVSAFEAAFADYCGTRHCAGVGNGTDALEIALRAVGTVPGDAVLLAANAAMYGTTAAMAIGAEPVFADIDPACGLLTADTIRAALELHARPVKALIVTHLYGRLTPMDELASLCRATGIAIVEDCAQAHGVTCGNGRRAGELGDIATFSFYPTKNLGAIGDGGAVVCQDPVLDARCRQLRQYGWTTKYTNALSGGRNSRLDELQAAFLLALLPDLDRRNALRRSIANRYSREISNPRIEVPIAAGGEYVAHLFVIQAGNRDGLAHHLRAHGIACDVHYPVPDHRQPILAERYRDLSLPITERWCSRVLTLPCFPELSEQEVDRVVAACNAWDGGGRKQ